MRSVLLVLFCVVSLPAHADDRAFACPSDFIELRSLGRSFGCYQNTPPDPLTELRGDALARCFEDFGGRLATTDEHLIATTVEGYQAPSGPVWAEIVSSRAGGVALTVDSSQQLPFGGAQVLFQPREYRCFIPREAFLPAAVVPIAGWAGLALAITVVCAYLIGGTASPYRGEKDDGEDAAARG